MMDFCSMLNANYLMMSHGSVNLMILEYCRCELLQFVGSCLYAWIIIAFPCVPVSIGFGLFFFRATFAAVQCQPVSPFHLLDEIGHSIAIVNVVISTYMLLIGQILIIHLVKAYNLLYPIKHPIYNYLYVSDYPFLFIYLFLNDRVHVVLCPLATLVLRGI